ncbi:AbiH family protein, partial [Phocaeicola plebeius]
MKHLYIIGNGFDIHTGLATRYADFQLWLENNYPFIYENMQAVYDIDAEWWNDFEVQLGNLDINKFVSKFTPPAKPIDEIIAEAKRKRDFEERYNIPPSLHFDSYCAKRLKGLLDVLQYC